MNIKDAQNFEGERDESCIEESPEARKKSRVANVMVEQNKRSLG
jgi:hypothetical protein